MEKEQVMTVCKKVILQRLEYVQSKDYFHYDKKRMGYVYEEINELNSVLQSLTKINLQDTDDFWKIIVDSKYKKNLGIETLLRVCTQRKFDNDVFIPFVCGHFISEQMLECEDIAIERYGWIMEHLLNNIRKFLTVNLQRGLTKAFKEYEKQKLSNDSAFVEQD